MNANLDIRPSPIAGQWYPGDPKRLSSSVDGYIHDAVLPELDGEVVAIVTPHAGHIYSGPVAGYAFATLRGLKPDLVAVISPMHYPYNEPFLTTAHDAYQTPLGLLMVDREAVQKLSGCLEEQLGYGLSQVKRDREHSLEIELPFLQRVIESEFKLLPVMVREQDRRGTQALGICLAKTLEGRSAVLVASTDLSHFYPLNLANQLDEVMLNAIASFDPDEVIRAEEEGRGFACGRGALAAVLWAARDLGADRVKVLKHATSAEVTGDKSQVVGYGSAVVLRSTPGSPG
ncbi:MAG: AmmeMemoRadiSam system protein B [Anaerolineales bacterium]|nr:MAG: AmmeMemoRadiSam system protein B [Anaerolineales bacterium]